MSRLLRVSAVLLGLALAPGLAAGKPPQSIPSLAGVSSAPGPASVTVDPNGNTSSKIKVGVEIRSLYDIRDQGILSHGAARMSRISWKVRA